MDYKNELLKVFSELLILLKSGVEFGQGQIPILIEEILTYELAISSIGLAFGIILIIIVIVAFINDTLLDVIWEHYEIGPMLGLIITVLGLLFISINLPDVFKIIYAPRLYLIEYVQTLIK